MKLYVNYFSPSSTFTCALLLTLIFQRFVTRELQLCFTNRCSILQPSRLLDVKLTPKSATDGIVYRVGARLSTARVFSGRICTPRKGRLLLMKSLTAFLNSELRKLYKTGLMAELR